MKRVVLCLALSSAASWSEKPTQKGQRLFDTRVAPLLTKRCLGCHNDQLDDGNISFLNRNTLLKGGSHGPAIVPGDPENSVLIQAVRQGGELKMPPGGKLSPREVQSLVEWIKLGAPWGTKLNTP